MDLFDVPRKMKKVASPIKHLLREDAKEDDPLPKPTWGAANAPPIVGAVHKRPREANVSFSSFIIFTEDAFIQNATKHTKKYRSNDKDRNLHHPNQPHLLHRLLLNPHVDQPQVTGQDTTPKETSR
jgi:hypothetical protein